MKSTTVATFKEQLRRLFVELKQVTKEHFGEKHDILHAAKDLFEMALIESRPTVDPPEAKKQKAANKEAIKAECLKQELQQLKKYHKNAMKEQKAKFDKKVAHLNRLYAEVKAQNEKLVSIIDDKKRFNLQLFLKNSELKEDVEKLTEAELNGLRGKATTNGNPVSNTDDRKQFILKLYLENSELKEKIEILTEENDQLRSDLESQKLKFANIQNIQKQRFQTYPEELKTLINQKEIIETWV